MKANKFTYNYTAEANYFDRLNLNRDRNLTRDQVSTAWRIAITPLVNQSNAQDEYILLNRARDDLIDPQTRN